MRFHIATITTSDGRTVTMYLNGKEDADFIVRAFKSYSKVAGFDYAIYIQEAEILPAAEVVRVVVESFREQRDQRKFIDKIQDLLNSSGA